MNHFVKKIYNLWRYKTMMSEIYAAGIGKCVAQTLCHGSVLWLLSLWPFLLTGGHLVRRAASASIRS